MTVAQRVKQARLAKGLNQRDAAEAAGLSTTYVHQLERSLNEDLDQEASIKSPKADTLEKLANALGVTVEWLAYGVGKGPVAPKRKGRKAA